MSKVTTARVTMTIEVNVPSTWGDDCSVKQVREQAITDARSMANQLAVRGNVKIVGEPQVVALMALLDKE